MANNKSYQLQVDQNNLQKQSQLDFYRGYIPKLNLSANYLNTASKEAVDDLNYQLRVDLNQTLYDQGEAKSARQFYQYEQTLVNTSEKSERQGIVSSAQEAYLLWLFKRASVITRSNYFELAQREYEIVEKKRELGQANELALLETQSQLQQAEFDLLKALQEESESQNRLKLVLNLPLDVDIATSEDLEFLFELGNGDLEFQALWSVYRKENMEIYQAYVQTLKSGFAIKKTRKALIPAVNLNAYVSLNDNVFVPTEVDYGLGLSLSSQFGKLPLGFSVNYDNRRDDSQRDVNYKQEQQVLRPEYIKARKILENQYKQSLENYRQIQKSKKIEFQNAFNVLNNQRKQIELLKSRLFTEEKKMELEKRRFNLGEIAADKYFEKQVQYNELKLSYFQSLYDYFRQVIHLESSLAYPNGSLNLINKRDQ